jgi:uncharacterized protein YceK
MIICALPRCSNYPIMAIAAILLFAVGIALSGCATTVSGVAAENSSVRIATIAYITRGKNQEEQSARAWQVVSFTNDLNWRISKIREASGSVLTVEDINTLAAFANQAINQSELPQNDKQLAQAVVIEAVMLAGDLSAYVSLDTTQLKIEEIRMERVQEILDQIMRVAGVFTISIPNGNGGT